VWVYPFTEIPTVLGRMAAGVGLLIITAALSGKLAFTRKTSKEKPRQQLLKCQNKNLLIQTKTCLLPNFRRQTQLKV
jgi:hypothetical protein